MDPSLSDTPAWLEEARRRWTSRSDGPPEKKWTAYWVERFLVYLRSRNKGKLPERPPSMGIVNSFCRFIVQKWEVEEWKADQARAALEWLAGAAGFSGLSSPGSSLDAGRHERRAGVRLPAAVGELCSCVEACGVGAIPPPEFVGKFLRYWTERA